MDEAGTLCRCPRAELARNLQRDAGLGDYYVPIHAPPHVRNAEYVHS